MASTESDSFTLGDLLYSFILFVCSVGYLFFELAFNRVLLEFIGGDLPGVSPELLLHYGRLVSSIGLVLLLAKLLPVLQNLSWFRSILSSRRNFIIAFLVILGCGFILYHTQESIVRAVAQQFNKKSRQTARKMTLLRMGLKEYRQNDRGFMIGVTPDTAALRAKTWTVVAPLMAFEHDTTHRTVDRHEDRMIRILMRERGFLDRAPGPYEIYDQYTDEFKEGWREYQDGIDRMESKWGTVKDRVDFFMYTYRYTVYSNWSAERARLVQDHDDKRVTSHFLSCLPTDYKPPNHQVQKCATREARSFLVQKFMERAEDRLGEPIKPYLSKLELFWSEPIQSKLKNEAGRFHSIMINHLNNSGLLFDQFLNLDRNDVQRTFGPTMQEAITDEVFRTIKQHQTAIGPNDENNELGRKFAVMMIVPAFALGVSLFFLLFNAVVIVYQAVHALTVWIPYSQLVSALMVLAMIGVIVYAPYSFPNKVTTDPDYQRVLEANRTGLAYYYSGVLDWTMYAEPLFVRWADRWMGVDASLRLLRITDRVVPIMPPDPGDSGLDIDVEGVN